MTWNASSRLVLRLLSEGARTGNELERPYRLYDLALVELTAGRLPEAGWALRAGTMAAADAGNRDAAGWLAYPRALWHALVGRADEARASAAELLDAAGRPGGLPAQARAHRVLGALALAHGDLATAAEELGTAVELLQRWGIRHPGVVPALPDAVEAYAGTGDLAGARGLMAQLEDQVERTGSAWASVVLRRSRAVVMLADGDANSAADELLEVATALAGLGHRLEAGRALLLAGQALLRAGRRTAAADTLCTAHDDFGRYGAVLWQARAWTEAERAAAGRATGCLTPTERRVVQLVVDGRRNREIAAEMYLGVATVEAHLTRTYRKLGIRSRSELVGLVGRGDLDLDRGFSR